MDFLPQPAKTAEECTEILRVSMDLRAPLGVPTVLIDPMEPLRLLPAFMEGALPDSILRAAKTRLIQTRIADALKAAPAGIVHPGGSEDFDHGIHPSNIASTILSAMTTQPADADMIYAQSLPNFAPRFNIVLFRPVADTVRKELGLSTSIPAPPGKTWPGHDAQHNTFNLWHEYAHGLCGKHEPLCDHIAALFCRRAFADPTFLQVEADLRAVDMALLCDEGEVFITRYGWPCVAAIDSVIAMPQPPRDAEIAARIATIHDMPQHFMPDAVMAVGETFLRRAQNAISDGNWSVMADQAAAMVRKNVFTEPDAVMIARRLALAMRRLTTGTPAYRAEP